MIECYSTATLSGLALKQKCQFFAFTVFAIFLMPYDDFDAASAFRPPLRFTRKLRWDARWLTGHEVSIWIHDALLGEPLSSRWKHTRIYREIAHSLIFIVFHAKDASAAMLAWASFFDIITYKSADFIYARRRDFHFIFKCHSAAYYACA